MTKLKTVAVALIVLLLSTGVASKRDCKCESKSNLAGAAVGAVGAVVAVPYILGFLGFGPFGIVAGSIASKLMSTSALTGYGAAAIATTQSIATAGLGAGGMAAVGTGGAIVGNRLAGGGDCDC